MEQIYTPKQDYKVLVRCFTYNHSKYIEDALNGFAMQKTNFPFVCLVMDDCSTDGEQDVIKAWMERECDMEKAEYVDLELSNVILVPHMTNANCTFAFYLLKQNLYGTGDKKMKHVTPWRDHCEYEAMCEGDDYWIAQDKLQIQVQFLDEYLEYSMCFHSANMLIEGGVKPVCNVEKVENREYTADEILSTWTIPTASVMVRKEVLSYPIKGSERIMYGDIFIFLKAFANGRVRGFKEKMSIYRINDNGYSNNKKASIDRAKRSYDHFTCIKENFPFLNNEIIDNLRVISLCQRAETHYLASDRIADYKQAAKINKNYVLKKYIKTRILGSIRDFFKIV